MRFWITRTTVAVALALVCASGVSAQATGSIVGSVVDRQTMAPVEGAHVQVLGTDAAVLANREGRFVLPRVPVGTVTLRVRSIGYASAEQTVTVGDGATVTQDIQLQPQAVALEGLVVVGYGTQRREEITGAVASVSADQFVAGPARNAASLIVGRIPGLAVTTPSGDPRANPQISLRGITTVRGSRSPLVLIDGIPGSLATVAPQDIESIDVLKDGSAAAVYGSRASNGVILITTRRHEGGAPTIRYEGYVDQQTIYNRPDFLQAADYRRLIGEGYEFDDWGFQTDWLAEVLRNPVSHRHSVTVAGGGLNTNYTGSVTYEDRQGIAKRSEVDFLTARANVGHAMFDGRLHADLNLLTRIQNSFEGPNFAYMWRQALIRNPTDRIRNDEGTWQERSGYFYINPLGQINEQHGNAENRTLRLHGVLTYRPIDNLRLSLLTGTQRGSTLSGNATTHRHYNTVVGNAGGEAYRWSGSNEAQTLEFTSTYADNIQNHNFTLLGGYSYQRESDESFWFSTYDFPTDLFGYHNLGVSAAMGRGQAGVGSGAGAHKTIGFFSRLNYDWSNRYLLMLSTRYEGDSRFGADHQWGMFPAVQVGWRLSQEPFLRDRFEFLNDVKLRAGFGVTGMAPTDRYLHEASYRYAARFPFEGQWVQGLIPARNPNPDLRWEKKEETNIGIDFSVLDYRLSGSLDYYQRDTKDLLFDYSVPVPPYLFGSIRANVGVMRNSGMEAELTYDVIRRANMRWSTSANWSTNSNKLVRLSDDAFQTSDWFVDGHTGEPIQQWTHRIEVGQPIGNFWGWKSVDIDAEGYWIVQNKDGEPIPINLATQDDRHILGNGIPQHYAAWINNVSFGAFDLSTTMRGAFGYQILNFQRMYYENPKILHYNMLRSAFEPVYGKRLLNNDLAYVSHYIEDGDFWKVDNVTLGYTVNPGQLPGLANVLTGARLYLSARNLWTITGYRGVDPEVPVLGLAPGNDHRDTYPTTRHFTMGVNLTF
jgi:TonB-dependent starch-binding outer membrane protein SusC